uniref:Protein photinus pyralis n=1 Tax=Xenopsylla cheopis TaxID=163159 RepID=A0A6M2DL89_XENCH
MIAKSCPKCDHQVAVACKACVCGHSFFNSKKPSQRVISSEDQRRRTGRVRREKPNFYDSREYEKAPKKRSTRTRNSDCIDDDDTGTSRRDTVSSNGTTASRAKRRRARKEESDGGGDIVSKLSPEKQALCSIILAELNNKIQRVLWKPNF